MLCPIWDFRAGRLCSTGNAKLGNTTTTTPVAAIGDTLSVWTVWPNSTAGVPQSPHRTVVKVTRRIN